MYLLIGADIVPTKSNQSLFEKRDAETLVGKELLSLLEQSSYNIFNLEVPLTDVSDPIEKQGPNLIASVSSSAGLKALFIHLLTIANNHIMDQGDTGLLSTVEALTKAGIHSVGAGRNPEEAGKPFLFRFADRKVGVYACAEHEFSIVGKEKPGANPFDPLWTLEHISELKKNSDYVIVLYHGGKEHYRYPSPNLQKVCRRIADSGADLVICQHSHCVGCEEKYKGSTIVYGQGNFLFDDTDNEFWNTGLLIFVDEKFCVSYLPLMKQANTVRLAEGEAGEEIIRAFLCRSDEILTEGFIEKKYTEFAAQQYTNYLNALAGRRGFLFRLLNKLTGGRYRKHYLEKTYDRKARLRIENYLECEAHRELMLTGLKMKR